MRYLSEGLLYLSLIEMIPCKKEGRSAGFTATKLQMAFLPALLRRFLQSHEIDSAMVPLLFRQ